MTTEYLDSQIMLGINAKPEDRVTVKISVTCSPFHHSGLVSEMGIGNYTIAQYKLGAIASVTNITYLYNEVTPETDSTLHLLRMALGDPAGPGNTWALGTLNVPVLRQGAEVFGRPANLQGKHDLASFPGNIQMPSAGGSDDGSVDTEVEVDVDSLQENPDVEGHPLVEENPHPVLGRGLAEGTLV